MKNEYTIIHMPLKCWGSGQCVAAAETWIVTAGCCAGVLAGQWVEGLRLSPECWCLGFRTPYAVSGAAARQLGELLQEHGRLMAISTVISCQGEGSGARGLGGEFIARGHPSRVSKQQPLRHLSPLSQAEAFGTAAAPRVPGWQSSPRTCGWSIAATRWALLR